MDPYQGYYNMLHNQSRPHGENRLNPQPPMHPPQPPMHPPPFYFHNQPNPQYPMDPPPPQHYYPLNPNQYMYPTPPYKSQSQIGDGSINEKLPGTEVGSADDEPQFSSQV